MKARIAALAFFLSSAAVAVCWLTTLPIIARLMDALRRAVPEGSPEAELLRHIRTLVPFYMLANLLVVAALCGLILYFTLARPLAETEAAIERLGSLRLELPVTPGGGPIVSRVQAALRRMASALAEEQALTRRQLRDLREANEQITRAQSELLAAERLATVGRLAAGVAHEVGNPLSGILGYLSLIRAKAKDPEVAEYVDRIDAEVQRINQIVRGLLDLGRPPQLSPRPVALAALVETCLELVRAGPELRDVRIDVDIPEDVTVRADPGPLSQIVINLLINAGQALKGTGTVRISAAPPAASDGDVVSLVIDDSGPGLTPEARARLFEPFFTTKGPGQGTGLGLATSLQLVRAMQGRLRAEDSPEGGARFVVELPRV